MITCLTCLEEKDENDFYLRNKVTGNRCRRCKACNAKTARSRYGSDELAYQDGKVIRLESHAKLSEGKKSCTSCLTEKSLSEFYFRSKAKGILQSRCKECQVNNKYEYYLDNKEKLAAKQRDRKAQAVNFVNGIKMQSGCSLCEESEPVVLDFHHLHSVDKSDSISKMIRRRKTISEIQAEIDKCVILCSNCHRKVHAGIIQLKHEGFEPSSEG